MRSYLDLPADIERHYHDVCQTFERLIGKLSQPSCQSHTHGEIEELIHAEGMELPEGVRVQVVENTAQDFTLVIPAQPTDLSDEELDGAAGGVCLCTNHL